MPSLKQQLISGVLYTALSKYIGIIVSLVVSGVLARLLSPEDFGVMAIATVIITFFSIFSDMGISAAVIQKKELDKDDLSSIFSFTVILGVIISLLFFFGSWPIAKYYDNEILKPFCQILSINLLFASFTIVPNALLSKEKRFKYLATIKLSIQIICGTIAVVAALYGAGLYALTINPVLSSIFIFIACYKEYPTKFRFRVKKDSIIKIFNYSAYQFLFSIVNYFSNNLDKLMIGKYMGMGPLGYYEKSYRLMTLPIQNITYVINPVMHPIFSDFQNDKEKLSASYEKVVKFINFIGFPLSAILFFAAREVVLIIFGPQWEASVPIFQILAITIGIQVVITTSGAIFQASNDTKSLFICGTFSSALNVLGIVLGIFVFKDLKAIAWCLTASYTINFLQCYLQMYYVTFKRSIKTFFQKFISPIICTAIISAALYPASILLADSNIIISVVIKGILFVLIWGAYLQISKEFDIIGKCKSFLKKGSHTS